MKIRDEFWFPVFVTMAAAMIVMARAKYLFLGVKNRDFI